jgi:hypothetical protein
MAARTATEAEATRWRAAHAVEHLAPRLLSTLKGLWADRPLQDIWRVDGSSRMLRTAVGRVDKRTLLTTGVAGMWVFGPYLPLRPGRHRLSIDWEGRCGKGNSCALQLVCAGATVQLGQKRIAPASGPRHSLTFEFENALPRNDVEIQIEVPADADIRLYSLTIESLASSAGSEAPATATGPDGAVEHLRPVARQPGKKTP